MRADNGASRKGLVGPKTVLPIAPRGFSEKIATATFSPRSLFSASFLLVLVLVNGLKYRSATKNFTAKSQRIQRNLGVLGGFAVKFWWEILDLNQ